MKELSINERHFYYKELLKILLAYPNNGFCFCISVLNHKNDDLFLKIGDFSELMMYKPKEVFYRYNDEVTNDPIQFWFPMNNNEIRIKILNEVIKLTET